MDNKEEIKFPFKPNEKVIKAFEKQVKRRIAARAMIEEIIDILSDEQIGFEIFYQEYPQIKKHGLVYNSLEKTIEKKE